MAFAQSLNLQFLQPLDDGLLNESEFSSEAILNQNKIVHKNKRSIKRNVNILYLHIVTLNWRKV